MNFEIREALPEDADEICALNTRALGYAYPADETAKALRLLRSGHDRIFVATAAQKVVGCIHARDYDTLYAPPFKDILGLAVAGEFRKNGIGRALLAAVETWARQTGACGVRLVSGMTRTDAHAFYRRCGYCGDKQQLNLKKIF